MCVLYEMTVVTHMQVYNVHQKVNQFNYFCIFIFFFVVVFAHDEINNSTNTILKNK